MIWSAPRTLSGVVLALVLGVVLLTSSAWAGLPEHVRVSWDQEDTAHTGVVTWNSSSQSDKSQIQYGITPDFGMEAVGSSFKANGDLGYVHEVTLEDLTPDTVYHYRVGGPAAWSTTYSFRTGPAHGCDPFRFVALGDNRGDTSWAPSTHWNPILTEALAHGPSFILNTGDLVKDGDDVAQWKAFLETTGEGIAGVPLMPSLGNHDDDKVAGDDASYNQLFTLPRNPQTNSEDYYFFRYGDALFAAISTATFKDGTNMADQAAWLDQVFTENPATWRFVYFHHPIYTGSVDLFGAIDFGHPPNELQQNQHLVPVFDKHHVDIVFNGHNHFYQRFEPMCCGGGSDTGVPTGDPATGTVYIITGGAGAITYDLPGLDLLLGSADGSVAVSGKHHYVLIEVDGLDLTGKVYTTASQLFDNSQDNIKLIDEFTISKTGPAPSCEPEVADEGASEDTGSAEPVVEEETPNADAGATAPEATTPEEDTEEPGPIPSDDVSVPASDAGATPGPGAGSGRVPSNPPAVPSGETSSGDSGGGCALDTGSGSSGDPWLILLAGLLALTHGRRVTRSCES